VSLIDEHGTIEPLEIALRRLQDKIRNDPRGYVTSDDLDEVENRVASYAAVKEGWELSRDQGRNDEIIYRLPTTTQITFEPTAETTPEGIYRGRSVYMVIEGNILRGSIEDWEFRKGNPNNPYTKTQFVVRIDLLKEFQQAREDMVFFDLDDAVESLKKTFTIVEIP
jgi:hypothetical protein